MRPIYAAVTAIVMAALLFGLIAGPPASAANFPVKVAVSADPGEYAV
jgi:hypothetical protein